MIEALLSGLTMGLLLAISVGPVIFAIIKQSLTHGHKGGYTFIAGVSASDIMLVLVCNALTVLFQQAVSHKMVIGISGSVFLVIIGIYTLFFKKAEVKTDDTEIKKFRKRELVGIFLSGFFMNILNPGVFIFWLASTAKIHEQAEAVIHPIQYRIIAFTTCLLFVLATDIAKVLLAGKIRPKLTPHNIHIINRISGLILIGFGVALIWGLVFHGNAIH